MLLLVEMTQSTLNKVQVDHDVDVALHSLQRGIVTKLSFSNAVGRPSVHGACFNALSCSLMTDNREFIHTVPDSAGGKGGILTFVGWQVTL